MRQCQDNAYLRSTDAAVTAYRTDKKGLHWVQLDSSLFYPEAGGQPADHGRIGAVRVCDVQRQADGVWHQTEAALELKSYPIEIDWERRFDHMQQHTGQHMLTALILERHGWMTLGFQLGSTISTIELDTAHIDRQTCLSIEAMANACILEDRHVRAKVVERSDLTALGVRTRGLPDYVEGPIRLIEIEDLDLNTCGGTHLKRTGELQLCKILGTESIRGRTRLQFLFGGRVLQYCEAAFLQEAKLNHVFGQGADAHVALAEKWLAERKAQAKTIARLEEQWVEAIAASLKPQSGLFVHYNDTGTLDMCGQLARRLAEAHSDIPVLISGREAFVFYDPKGIMAQYRGEALAFLEGRGGGRPPWMQGKCTKPEAITSVAAWYRQKSVSG